MRDTNELTVLCNVKLLVQAYVFADEVVNVIAQPRYLEILGI